MPLTVKTLFNKFDIDVKGPTNWIRGIENNSPGIYVITISPLANEIISLSVPPIDIKKIGQWINVAKNIKIDGISATSDNILKRLSDFWLNDETILYIGSTKSLRHRIKQYYIHKLGESKPHRGGDWIKTLEIFDNLNIFYGYTNNYKNIEIKMLEYFSKNVSLSHNDKVRHCPMPFANKTIPNFGDKPHEIRNATV